MQQKGVFRPFQPRMQQNRIMGFESQSCHCERLHCPIRGKWKSEIEKDGADKDDLPC